jgi:hypothetical protein
MAYSQSTSLLHAPIPITGDDGLASEEQIQGKTFDAAIEGAALALCDSNGNGVISGWTIAAGTGLSVDIAAGKGFLGGIYCASAALINLAGLPASQAAVYIYAVRGALPNYTKAVSFQFNTTGTPPTGGAEIARCTTGASSVTSVDNDSAGRPPLAGGMPRSQTFDAVADQSAYVLDHTPRTGLPVRVSFGGRRLAETSGGTVREFNVSGSTVNLENSIVPPSGEDVTGVYLIADYYI